VGRWEIEQIKKQELIWFANRSLDIPV